MQRAALAPIRMTDFAPRITRSGLTGLECWGAETTDGEWSFEREDRPATPWAVYHRLSLRDGSCPRPVTLCSSLRACRAEVASGVAAKELERRKAETETRCEIER